MKKALLTVAATGLFTLNSAFATGFMHSELCKSVVNPDRDPEIVFATVSHAAPGGPVFSTTTLTVENLGKFTMNEDGSYDEIDIKVEPLQTPSGSFSSFLKFITLETEGSSEPVVREELYLCKTQGMPNGLGL